MAAERGVTITWLGHATTLLETPDGKRILIDPWLQNNPATPGDRKSLDQLDLMLITHGHFDHMGDAVEVARATKPDVLAVFEIAAYLQSKGIEKTNGFNHGGTVEWNGIAVTMVNAIHSSGITEGDTILYGGTAAGFVLRFANDFTVYHAGDTELFGDMKQIGDRFNPDVALLPIGGHFTMGPTAAAEAARLLGATAVIPIHYGTFPVLTGTPEELEKALAGTEAIRVVALKPGESANQQDLV